MCEPIRVYLVSKITLTEARIFCEQAECQREREKERERERERERELRSLSVNNGELANEGRGGHQTSRDADHAAQRGREGGKFDLDRIGVEVVARGQGAYEAVKSAVVRIFF